MALWDKVKQELDRAGRTAQGAFDEGKLRLEVIRVRQLADRAAQALGYTVYREMTGAAPADDAARERLREAIAEHEAEAERMQARLDEMVAERKGGPRSASPDADDAARGASSVTVAGDPSHHDAAPPDTSSSGAAPAGSSPAGGLPDQGAPV